MGKIEESVGMRAVLFFLSFLSLFAIDDSPACFLDLQRNFFDGRVVSEALSLYDVPQSLWFRITRDLRREGRDLPAILRARSRQMRSSPMDRPFNREGAFKMLQQELKTIYTNVLIQNGVTNSIVIEETFNYIYNNDYERISACYDAIDFP